MICFEIYINGERICRAGREDLASMTASLVMVRFAEPERDDQLSLFVNGKREDTSRGHVHPFWLENQSLAIGDEFTVRIVDSETSDKPLRDFVQTDEEVLHNERVVYEHLKAKFETET